MFQKVAIPEEDFVPKPEKSERGKRAIKQERAMKKWSKQTIKQQHAKKVKTGLAKSPSPTLITPERVSRSTAAARRAAANPNAEAISTAETTNTTLTHPTSSPNAMAISTGAETTNTTTHPTVSTAETTNTTLTRPTIGTNMETMTTVETNNTTSEDIFSKLVEVFQVPDVVEHILDRVPMGGGLNLFRTVGVLDEGIKAIIIKAEVGKGKQQSSNMQSILEIKETCDKGVPTFMWPDLQEIQGFVSSLLKPKGERNIIDTKNHR